MKKGKKAKGMKGGKGHIGRLPHGSHRLGGMGKDPHASAEHHAMNSKFGMPEGTGVKGLGDGGENSEQEAGEAMGNNEECC